MMKIYCVCMSCLVLHYNINYIYLFKEPRENISDDEEISDLVSFVQSKVKISHREVKVMQRSKPLDFSHLFNAIHGRRY